ncbi:hypothetical protein PENSUB_1077 [Penicillium subrubescens]|uniref:Uncharacterized protein n=1 Tax=Penicillium subrubescens TaxID=1316194 RepID=A0A1Q5UL92_9EURO|nr:hypothetical protein PENSUB_1077 [Penicillium subrubescens]
MVGCSWVLFGKKPKSPVTSQPPTAEETAIIHDREPSCRVNEQIVQDTKI